MEAALSTRRRVKDPNSISVDRYVLRNIVPVKDAFASALKKNGYGVEF